MARRFTAEQITQARLSTRREADTVQAWRWSANLAVGASSGAMLKVVYDADLDGFVEAFRVPLRGALGTGPLPVATALTRGLFYETTTGGANPRSLYYCIENILGGFEWIIVGQASQ